MIYTKFIKVPKQCQIKKQNKIGWCQNMQNLLVQTVLKKFELFGCVFRMVDEAKEVYSQRWWFSINVVWQIKSDNLNVGTKFENWRTGHQAGQPCIISTNKYSSKYLPWVFPQISFLAFSNSFGHYTVRNTTTWII